MGKKDKAKAPRSRDPFWRLRRVFGEKRRESAKSYRRAESRKTEQEASHEPE